MSTINRTTTTGNGKQRKQHAKANRRANRAATFHAAASPAHETVASRRGLHGTIHAVRVGVALLLMAAATIKFHHHAIAASMPASGWDIVQVVGEWALGLWLLSAWKLSASWLLTLGMFTLFTGYSLRQGIAGAESCGCFGPVQASPWLMLGVDLLVVAALAALYLPMRTRHTAVTAAAAKKSATRHRPRLTPAITLALLVLVTTVPAAIAMAVVEAAQQAPSTTLTDPPRDYYLEPESWLNGPLPILGAIDVRDQLAQGRWTMLFYRHTCPACHQAIDRWLASLDNSPGAGTSGGGDSGGEPRLALIEVPPLDEQPDEMIVLAKELGFLHGQLAAQHRWFFTTPTVVQLEQGRVMHVGRDPLATWAGTSAGATLTPALPERPRTTATHQVLAASTTPPPPDAQSPPPPLPAPDAAASFQQPSAFDLGYVAPGGVKETTITLRNNLDRDLPIRSVHVECICTKVLAAPTVLPAEGQAELRLRFEAFEQPQHYAKHVTLLTDDPHVPRIELPLRARIGLPLAVEPAVLEVAAPSSPGDTSTAQQLPLLIRNDGPDPVRLLYSTASAPGLIAPVPREPIASGGEATLQITVPADLPKSARIQIVTDAPHQNHLHVPVRKAGP